MYKDYNFSKPNLFPLKVIFSWILQLIKTVQIRFFVNTMVNFLIMFRSPEPPQQNSQKLCLSAWKRISSQLLNINKSKIKIIANKKRFFEPLGVINFIFVKVCVFNCTSNFRRGKIFLKKKNIFSSFPPIKKSKIFSWATFVPLFSYFVSGIARTKTIPPNIEERRSIL